MHGLAQLIEMWGPGSQWDGIGVPKPDSFSHPSAIPPGWLHPHLGLYITKEMRSSLEQSCIHLQKEPHPTQKQRSQYQQGLTEPSGTHDSEERGDEQCSWVGLIVQYRS